MNEAGEPGPIQLRGPHLVVLVGGAGAGKSTWAQARFLPTQIVSTDRCRALVGDREEVQAYSKQAFELFYFLIEKRMELGKHIVADSTGLDPAVRRNLLGLAYDHGYPAIAVVFTAGLDVRRARNRERSRQVADEVLIKQQEALERALSDIRSEGWESVFLLGPEEADRARVERLPVGVYNNKQPPYDIVGDVHGCLDELRELIEKLGWVRDGDSYTHPEGRTLVSLGDLADRGPDVPGCFRLWMQLVADGKALFVPGNHDNKLMRYLMGRNVRITHGLEQSAQQLDNLSEAERNNLRTAILRFIRHAPPYLILDSGKLIVAHAGIKAQMIGKVSKRIQDFTLYGDVTGERTPEGLPVRRDWAAKYHGRAFVVYGHTPVQKPGVRNNTVNIDTGCVFGGALTALRYPEKELVEVRARRAYYARPGAALLPED
ncbi:MAG: AAA family ATPase [Chloroflexota bacterium]|nr:AAA family ATPase [Chloroflexota bacterium]